MIQKFNPYANVILDLARAVDNEDFKGFSGSPIINGGIEAASGISSEYEYEVVGILSCGNNGTINYQLNYISFNNLMLNVDFRKENNINWLN